MARGPPRKEARIPTPTYAATPDDVFEAALETVRALPGWEVMQAKPDRYAIHARARGRIFSPTVDHEFHLETTDDGTVVRMESRTMRTQQPDDDPRHQDMFHAFLSDRMTERTRQRTIATPKAPVPQAND